MNCDRCVFILKETEMRKSEMLFFNLNVDVLGDEKPEPRFGSVFHLRPSPLCPPSSASLPSTFPLTQISQASQQPVAIRYRWACHHGSKCSIILPLYLPFILLMHTLTYTDSPVHACRYRWVWCGGRRVVLGLFSLLRSGVEVGCGGAPTCEQNPNALTGGETCSATHQHVSLMDTETCV